MTDEILTRRIFSMIAELSTVRASDIRLEHRLREDLGLDSVCSMELLSMLAEEFELDVPMEEAAQLTCDFLDCLTRPVLARHGTLDKYTGDGLVAFWGAPLPCADHADLALDAAWEIVQEVRRFSAARQREGKPPLRVRIGIESGLAMAGDFGTSSRSIYTAVGDSVNVASRLEQLARDPSYDVIIGQGTASRTRRHRLKLLGDVVLRGKENPTTLYTLEPAGSPT